MHKTHQNVSARYLKDVPTTFAPLIQSSVTGYPKRPISTCYPLFKTERNEDNLIRSDVGDLVWLLVWYFQ